MILVSACLLGEKTKYNGEDNLNPLLKEFEKRGVFAAVCPECLGGLPTPRPPAEIQGGTGAAVWERRAFVCNTQGRDLTDAFLKGAEKSLEAVKKYRIQYAVLKARSPSCGSGEIYDGTFSGRTAGGDGVAAALLKRHGVTVFTEENLTRELLEDLLLKECE